MIKLLRINEAYDMGDDLHKVALTAEMVDGPARHIVVDCEPNSMLLNPAKVAKALRWLADNLEGVPNA